MKKRFAVMLGMGLMAGCGGSSPTITAEASGPALDGGVIFGSGHRSDSTSTTTQNNNATTQASGGVIFGSGN